MYNLSKTTIFLSLIAVVMSCNLKVYAFVTEGSLGHHELNFAQFEYKIDDEVVVYLKDGSTVEGLLIERDEEYVVLETSYGEVRIKTENIERIEFKDFQSSQPNESRDESRDSFDSQAIGRAMLYDSRKKRITTAIGFEALGGGLLYAERYTAGTLMLLSQAGLIAGSFFVDDPDVQAAMGIGALTLKGVNLVLTVRAVNSYNNDLLNSMRLQQSSNEEISSGSAPFEVPNGAGYLEIGGKNIASSINAEIRFNQNYSMSFSYGIPTGRETLIEGYRDFHNIPYFDKLRSSGVMLHRVFGQNRSKFELGLGLTYYSYNRYLSDADIVGVTNSDRLYPNPLIGYRYESLNKILFRLNMTTFASPDSKASIIENESGDLKWRKFSYNPMIGISIGYSF